MEGYIQTVQRYRAETLSDEESDSSFVTVFLYQDKFIEFLLLACVSCSSISGIFQDQGVLKLCAIVYFCDIFNSHSFGYIG